MQTLSRTPCQEGSGEMLEGRVSLACVRDMNPGDRKATLWIVTIMALITHPCVYTPQQDFARCSHKSSPHLESPGLWFLSWCTISKVKPQGAPQRLLCLLEGLHQQHVKRPVLATREATWRSQGTG